MRAWGQGCLVFLLVAATSAWALPTQKEALSLAFPEAEIQRREYFLTEAQTQQVKALAGVEVRNRFIVAYEAKKDGALRGVAFFDTHLVRTLPETAMVAVSPTGKVERIEVVSFKEPAEYQAPAGWKQQFQGKALDPNLALNRDIHPLSGASLTAQSLTDAARRSLAIFAVLYRRPSP